ncbi:MAG: hypothetical protein ACSHXL_01175 [Bacteroidota bacterium]
MKNIPEIKYVELKSGHSDNGPAWIGLVNYSKSGRTIYFNGMALQSLKGTGIGANYFNIENGDKYWISGVKKNLQDRHTFGSGVVYLEERIKNEYMNLVRLNQLDPKFFELAVLIEEIPKARISELENEKDEIEDNSLLRHKEPNELSIEQLQIVIEDLRELEIESKFNKARRSMKSARVEFQLELDNRESQN